VKRNEFMVFTVEFFALGRHWTDPPQRKYLKWSPDFVCNPI
jgi:hypothetical protein